MNKLEVFRGASADWTFEARLRGDSGAPEGFAATDPLVAKLWPGDARPPLAAPSAAWTDAPAGRFAVSLSDAQTAALAPGAYRVIVTASRAGKTIPLVVFAVEILESPGDASAPAVYCSAEDLEDQLGWVGQILDLKTDSTGFARQRRLAREWLDGLILRAYSGARADDHLTGALLGSAGPLLPDPWLSGLLESGALVLTGPAGRGLVRACAAYSLWLICNAQAPGSDQMRRAAAGFRREARKVAYRAAGIDTNGDGRPELAVWLGNVNAIEG